MIRRTAGRLLISLCSLCLASEARAQDAAGPAPVQVSGAINVNTKGISLVPALTLGRPAAIVDLVVRKGDASFEPQLRFALDGKPWSFLFWARYRAVTARRFRLTLGGHPAFSFRTTTASIGGASRDFIEVRRYLAGEATPTWILSPRTSVGAYYLYSHGIDPGAPPHTNLLAGRLYAANVPLPGRLVLQAVPQFYYLRTNRQSGTYVSATGAVGLRGSDWSLSTIVNQPIRSDVTGGQRFLWNVGVTYAFR